MLRKSSAGRHIEGWLCSGGVCVYVYICMYITMCVCKQQGVDVCCAGRHIEGRLCSGGVCV